MLASSFSTPLSKIFEIDIMIKLYFRRELSQFPKESSPYTQYEANQVYEDYVIDIADSYAFISRTLYLSAWYGNVAPVGILFGLAGLLLNYWVDKYQLLRMQSQPQSINHNVIKYVINTLELVPIIYILGSMQYQLRLTQSENVIKFIWNFFGYGVANIFLVIAFVMFFVFGRQKVPKGKLDKYRYDEVRMQFRTEYDACNPITKYEANKDWIKYLYKEKIISKEEEKKLMKQSIDMVNNSQTFQSQIQLRRQGSNNRNVTPIMTPRMVTNNNNENSQILSDMIELNDLSFKKTLKNEQNEQSEDDLESFNILNSSNIFQKHQIQQQQQQQQQ